MSAQSASTRQGDAATGACSRNIFFVPPRSRSPRTIEHKHTIGTPDASAKRFLTGTRIGRASALARWCLRKPSRDCIARSVNSIAITASPSLIPVYYIMSRHGSVSSNTGSPLLRLLPPLLSCFSCLLVLFLFPPSRRTLERAASHLFDTHPRTFVTVPLQQIDTCGILASSLCSCHIQNPVRAHATSIICFCGGTMRRRIRKGDRPSRVMTIVLTTHAGFELA